MRPLTLIKGDAATASLPVRLARLSISGSRDARTTKKIGRITGEQAFAQGVKLARRLSNPSFHRSRQPLPENQFCLEPRFPQTVREEQRVHGGDQLGGDVFGPGVPLT